MTTTTADFEPVDLVYDVYSGMGQAVPDPLPEITITGPIDGVWTIEAPDFISKEDLDAAIARQSLAKTLAENMQTLFDRISSAIQPNREFLALASPTVEENDTQIQALTRQINALLILRSGDFLDISGT